MHCSLSQGSEGREEGKEEEGGRDVKGGVKRA